MEVTFVTRSAPHFDVRKLLKGDDIMEFTEIGEWEDSDGREITLYKAEWMLGGDGYRVKHRGEMKAFDSKEEAVAYIIGLVTDD